MPSKSSYITQQGLTDGLPKHTVYDTAAEMPSSGLQEGDTAYSKDDDKFYKVTNSTTFTPITGGGSSAFSDLTGTASISQGGTGQSNAAAAINALLPSQTGNSGKYLTTDATNVSWGTVNSGSPFTTVRKTGLDQGNSSNTTLVPVNQMEFTLSANTNYIYEYWVRFETAATTTGLALAVDTPASPAFTAGSFMHVVSATAIGGNGTAGDNTVQGASTGALTGSNLAYFTGVVMNGANAGTMQLAFRSEVSASLTTIKTGTMGRIMTVA